MKQKTIPAANINTICTKDMKTNTFGMITKLESKSWFMSFNPVCEIRNNELSLLLHNKHTKNRIQFNRRMRNSFILIFRFLFTALCISLETF